MYRAVILHPITRVYEIERFEEITTHLAQESGGYWVYTSRSRTEGRTTPLGMLVYEFENKEEAEDFLDTLKSRDPKVDGYVSQAPKDSKEGVSR